MSNRQDIAFLTPFANDAETTLPGVPIDGTSYRDTAFSNLGPGWPYKTKVESQDFNQIMYIQTLLMRQISNQGVLDYSNKEDYTVGNALVKDDGGLYLCAANNGPASAVKQPITEPLFWRRIDITEVSPLNNAWNGYLDPEHQSSLPSPNGYPGNSGGGEVAYIADDEINFGIFAGSGGSTVSSDSDGWIFTGSIYRLYDYTTAQLAGIDINSVPVYLKGQDGSEYFANNATTGVNVTKPDANTLKVEITDAIFAELGITKLWRFFTTEQAGRVVEISKPELHKVLNFRIYYDETLNRTNGVTYTNPTDYKLDLQIQVTTPSGTAGSTDVIVNGAAVRSQQSRNDSYSHVYTETVSIPPRGSYSVSLDVTIAILKWSELRIPK